MHVPQISIKFLFATNTVFHFNDQDHNQLAADLAELIGRGITCSEYVGVWDVFEAFKSLHDGDSPEYLQYFYHSDHLGSSSFITDAAGLAEQHIQYLPFGELFVSQQNTSFDSRYKFTAKELDNETNYSYFGARYYDSDLSIWLSVDPLADKYPYQSPYTYCGWRPINIIDPDGNREWPVVSGFSSVENKSTYTRKIVSGFYRNESGRFHGAVDIVHRNSRGSISGGEVVATHDGKITASGYSETAGNWLQITNGDIRTTYMHLKDLPTPNVNDDISEGDAIGVVGNTGRSEGPHLHYSVEIKDNETGKWNKMNPVVGDIQKVDITMDVDLIDPQMLLGNPYSGGTLPLVTIIGDKIE